MRRCTSINLRASKLEEALAVDRHAIEIPIHDKLSSGDPHQTEFLVPQAFSFHRDTLAAFLAQALGLASLGIGLAELAAPRFVESMLGIGDQPRHRGILQVLGVRELMHGIGILAGNNGNRQLASGVWARVAGDVLDTALLGAAAMKTSRPARFAAVAAAVAAIGAADLYYARKASQRQHAGY